MKFVHDSGLTESVIKQRKSKSTLSLAWKCRDHRQQTDPRLHEEKTEHLQPHDGKTTVKVKQTYLSLINMNAKIKKNLYEVLHCKTAHRRWEQI